MKRLLLALLFAPAAWAAGGAFDAPASVPVKAYSWSLNDFTPQGFLSMRLTGSEARPGGGDRADLSEVNLTLFSGTPEPEIQTILISPQASWYPKERRVSGPGQVRVIRYNHDREICEMTGEDWSYDEAGKKVSIGRNLHLVYLAPLHGIGP